MIKSAARLLLVMALTFLPNCARKKIIKKHVHINTCTVFCPPEKPLENPPISVWVHGTKGWGSLSDFIHAVREPGLYHAGLVPHHYHLYHLIKTLTKADPVRFPYPSFYVFGWSGDLTFKARVAEAKKFYAALVLMSKEHEAQYGKKPDINIITHSHGGNVLLNLALAYDKKDELHIKRSILLACPVQHATKDLIKHPVFGTIYSFYSTVDMVQVLDPQGLYIDQNRQRKLEFSHRTFACVDNLRQVKLKINGHGILHSGFLTKSFVKMLPKIIDCADMWHKEHPCRDEDERILHINTNKKNALLHEVECSNAEKSMCFNCDA